MLRGKIRRRILSNHGFGFLVDSKNGILAIDPQDFSVSRTLLRHGEYDSGEIAWLKEVLGPETAVIVVVGAHIGALLIPLAGCVQRVIGFESNPRNFRFLELNILLNRVTNAAIVMKAVGRENTRVAVRHNSTNTGNSSIVPLCEGDNQTVVDMIKLDDAMVEEKRDIDLVIMDIEGHEVHAMEGASRTLKRTRYLYIEYAPDQLAEHGTSVGQFISSVREHFDVMQTGPRADQQYFGEEIAAHLESLPPRRGLLCNLLFSRSSWSR
jgi:FkbM family methyltransferase